MSINREAWLEKAIDLQRRTLFKPADIVVPDNVVASCGFPKAGGRGGSSVIGQCWNVSVSAAGVAEIFISPELDKPSRVLDILAHELCHATVGTEAGHKSPFAKAAKAIGLAGKMTHTIAGAGFKAWYEEHGVKLPEYPHKALKPGRNTGKQGTRLIKISCPECGYVARTTAKWLNDVGLPVCACGTDFTTEDGEE